ncbi:MotA/TolQ/ExbB proton channel family protein [Tautonia sociabilis]|uniref:Biopolymer transporter n=1 Tax=Tautonia sociabilis TaxID=2080755 RepID=A0A432MHD5_9BACT|nr:MotA/TolQ/ExbB proton channel family protein [Tautonia sociabilis]RUL86216.1 biopolymer transporter [Tautonia sociabilis]
MSRDAKAGARGGSSASYAGALALLLLALAFPVGLMVFNPTLMFERGWHQYAGTAIYGWALVMLLREWNRLRRDERAFAVAPELLDRVSSGEAVPASDRRLLPSRLRQLDGHARGEAAPTVGQLMELNREVSGLDQERTAGRFTLTKYILYLLPVIGFIGTVEGISHALGNISVVLPMVKELDGFLNNLTGVTSALQVAFDSTLLALFLSAALMFVQTVVYRLAEDHLARVDAWVVEFVLPRLGRPERAGEAIAPHLDRLREELIAAISDRLGDGFGPSVDRFAAAIDPLPRALDDLRRGAEAIGRLGDDLGAVGEANESIRRVLSALARIEAALAEPPSVEPQLEPIRRGLDRATVAVESLADQWASAFERSSRSTQEQLARTLASLKEALDLLHVSMEQGNALYRNIVRKMFDERTSGIVVPDASKAA